MPLPTFDKLARNAEHGNRAERPKTSFARALAEEVGSEPVLDLIDTPATEPHQSLPAPAEHPEFFPLTTFAALLSPVARGIPADPVKLETTGVTQQNNQRELFNRQLVFKSSVEAKLRQVGCLDLAGILTECHSRQSWAECTNCHKVKTFWNRCDNFFCPACQPHLARDRTESIEWWTHEVAQPKHVVLTARNTDQITFRHVQWFKSCLTKLRRSKFARGWRGGCWSLEVTNESRGWHLHAHLLVDAHWIDEQELAVKWGKLVGQEFAIVKVKDARGKDYLREVTKYAVKGSELAKWSGPDIAAFVYAFQGQRTFGVFGSLYGKRTQWRAWLDSICSEKGKCECGCNKWDIFDEACWKIHVHRANVLSGKFSLPPPVKPAQFSLGW